MAQFVENLGAQYRNFGLMVWLAHFLNKASRRRVYNKTHAELSQLSTRELDDLGISRSMISRLAYEAAYQK